MKKQEKNLPFLLRGLLALLIPKTDYQNLSGDFYQLYYTLYHSRGKIYARVWLWGQVLKSIPGFIKDSLYWRCCMFKKYFRIALRHIVKYRGYSFINIVGLAAGLACSIIIILYVTHELNYDSYHPDADCIFRVSHYKNNIVGESSEASVGGILAPLLKKNHPQVELAVRVIPPPENANHVLVMSKGKRFFENRMWFADPEIFKLFYLPFIKGNPDTALTRPGTIVITQAMAQKYFDSENPIGQILHIEIDYDRPPVKIEDYEVVGVIKNPPLNTHLKYDMFMPMVTFLKHRPDVNTQWFEHPIKYSYIKLRPSVNAPEFEEVLKRYAKERSEFYKQRRKRSLKAYRFFLQPITGIHMNSNLFSETEPGGNWYYIYIYSIVALLILLVGCMNFINISASISTIRTREVGLRKVVGAQRHHLVWQFLGESFLVTLFAFLGAFILSYILLPLFNQMAGTQLSLLGLRDTRVFLSLLGLLLVVSVGAGIYPAFILTAFRPVTVLQGKRLPNSRGSLTQKALVIGQFAISIFLVICTLIVYQQLRYMKGQALGFAKEQKLILRVKSNQGHFRHDYEAIKAEFKQNPEISGITASSSVPGEPTSGGYYMRQHHEADSKMIRLKVITMDFDFLKEYKIKMVAGRPFSRERGSDEKGAFIINRAGVKHLGFNSPEEVLGKSYWAHYHRQTKKIIGITENFHILGMQEEVEPMVMDIEPSLMNTFTVSVKTKKVAEVIAFLKKKWKVHFPGAPFEYSFLDQEFNRVYHYEEQVGQLLGIVTILGLTIAGLGLLGLVSFISRQRRKEIGIRKVLGASMTDIVKLLSRKFIVLVVVSMTLAMPLAWIAINKWLQDFAYRIKPGLWIFLLAGLMALVIALISVAFQGIRSAASDPVKTLRSE